MKKAGYLLALVLGVSSIGFAAACPSSQLLSVYDTAGYSCTIGPLVFSNFMYAAATPPAASGVTVTTVTGSEIGFTLTAPPNGWTGVSNDYILDYTVGVDTAICPLCKIDDALLAMTATVSGTGFATISETSTSPGSNVNLSVCAGIPGCPLTVTATFPATSSLSLVKDIFVFNGTGTATITSISQEFSLQTPEPASLALLGTALLGAGAILRRRLGRRATEAGEN